MGSVHEHEHHVIGFTAEEKRCTLVRGRNSYFAKLMVITFPSWWDDFVGLIFLSIECAHVRKRLNYLEVLTSFIQNCNVVT